MAAGWFYSPRQIWHYFITRPTTLKPPRVCVTIVTRTELANDLQPKFRNPFKILRELETYHWLMFIAGWLGWTWDSFDFFTVSLTVTEIARDFGVDNSEVTWV